MSLVPALDSADLVSWSIAASLIGGLVVMLLVRKSQASRVLALLFSLVPLAATTYMLVAVLKSPGAGYQFQHKYDWINLAAFPGFPGGLHINYIVGIDGISAPLSFLTAVLVTISIIFAWDESRNPGLFHGLLLLMDASVLGVFGTLDLFVFYVFWEFTLVPMFFLIAIWGGARRKYAAIKFFLYTFAGSLIMLLGFMALYFVSGTGSFAFSDILGAALQNKFSQSFQIWVFLALFIGFAVKFPVVPVHTWLPDAHVEAPTSGSVILAGVLLKMGSYGLLRIAFPMAPQGATYLTPLMFVIGAISVLYAAIICLSQSDYKRMVAYSSVGSMGLVLLGLASMTPIGVVGALFMMVAHGLSSPLMFMMCGVLQHNLGTREIPLMGGLASRMPVSASFIMVGSMAGLGLPGLALFPAEFQIFTGIWERFGVLVFIPIFYLMLSAAYWLWAMQRSLFGPLTEKIDLHHLYDVHKFEAIALAVTVVGLVVFGFWPRFITDPAVPSVGFILQVMGVH